MKDKSIDINLICDVCGNDQFSLIDGNQDISDLSNVSNHDELKCSDCERIITKENLLEENDDVINANVESFKKDVMKETKKEIKKRLKKFK